MCFKMNIYHFHGYKKRVDISLKKKKKWSQALFIADCLVSTKEKNAKYCRFVCVLMCPFHLVCKQVRLS